MVGVWWSEDGVVVDGLCVGVVGEDIVDCFECGVVFFGEGIFYVVVDVIFV